MTATIKRVTEYQIDDITVRYEPKREGQMYLKVVIKRDAETIGIDYLNCKFKPSRQNAAYFCAKHGGAGTGFSSEIETCNMAASTRNNCHVAWELASHLRLKPPNYNETSSGVRCQKTPKRERGIETLPR